MSFSDMVTQSILARALATLLLFIIMLLAAGIAAFDLIVGRAVPPEITTLLGGAIGYALTILGVNFGVVLQPLPEKKTASPPIDKTGL